MRISPGSPKKRNAFDAISVARNKIAAATDKLSPTPRVVKQRPRYSTSYGASGSAPVGNQRALADAPKFGGNKARETGSSNAVEGATRRRGLQPGSANALENDVAAIRRGNKSQLFQTGSANVTPYRNGNKNRPPITMQAAPAKTILPPKKGGSNVRGTGPVARNPGSSPAGGVRPPVTKAPISTIKAATKQPAVVTKAPVGNATPTAVSAKPGPVLSTIVDPASSNPGSATQPTQQAPANVDPYALFRKEAESIYKPQLDYLTGVENQQRGNAATADRNIGGMYDGLVKDIRGQQPGIEANYNDSMKQIQGVTDQGKAAINANYEKSRADQAAVLQRLGIQEAAPQTTQRGVEDQAYYTSGEDRSNNAYQRMLASQRSSAVDFNTSQANVTAQTGADQRAGVQKSLQDILGQLGGKRADAQTGIATQTIGLKKTADSMKAAQAQAEIDNKLAYDRMANQREIANVDNGFKQQQIDLEGRKVNNSETVAKNNNAIATAKLGIERAKTKADATFKQKQLDQALALGQGNLLLGQARLATQNKQNQSAAAAKVAASNQARKDKYSEIKRNQANLDRTFNAKAPGQSGWKDGPDPWADASKLANSMPRYNGKPSAVENAVGAIRDVVTGRGSRPGDRFDTLDNFIRTVLAHSKQSVTARDGSPGDASNLVSLATYLYPRLYKSGTRSSP